MAKKKKRKWKITGVLFLLFMLMMIVGGGFMISKKLNSKDRNIDYKKQEETKTANTNVDLQKAPENNQNYQTLSDGEYETSKGYILTIKEGVAYIEDHLIVNKTYSLPANYQPVDPAEAIESEKCINCLEKEVMSAFQLMKSDASSIGLNLYLASGYRSYKYQNTLYNNYTAVSGIEGADTYSARPGHSEHQTGLCFDLNSVEDSFATTDEGKWIDSNAYLYGFIIRYPKGKESITGYQYEPWHLRYVGKELAKKLYHDGSWITLEEYYGLSSSY